MHTDWRCDRCGPGPPLHVPARIDAAVMAAAVGEIARHPHPPPLWCPWPLPLGWTVTGVGWVADDRSGARATVLGCTGPAPLSGGPADLLLVAETPGTGLAMRYAGMGGPDPGPLLTEEVRTEPAHAKVRADGHPAPLWSVPSHDSCSAYAGEARGIWLMAVAWPPAAGYLLVEDLVLQDLVEWLPSEIVYGAPSARLRTGGLLET